MSEIDTSKFEDFPTISIQRLREMMPQLNGRTILWTDERSRYEPDELVSIDGRTLKTQHGEQRINGHQAYYIPYKGRQYLWWRGAFVMIEISDDACGKCINDCRREEGKCPFYQDK